MKKPFLAFITALAVLVSSIPVWAAPPVSPFPTLTPGGSYDVVFHSRMPDRPSFTGINDDIISNVAEGDLVDLTLLTNTSLAALTLGAIVSYGGVEYEFFGWYADSAVRDYYRNQLPEPALTGHDLYGREFRPWDFENDRVTYDKVVEDYNTAHTNPILYLYANWKEKNAHYGTVRYHLVDATGTPPDEQEVRIGADFSAVVEDITPGTVPDDPNKVFAGWSTSDYRKPNGELVLELKPGDRVDGRDEGADLYSVWVTPVPDTNAVTIDFNDTYQTIEGVGGSWAFHKWAGFKQIYDAFNAHGITARDENLGLAAFDMAMDEEAGVGMDIVRFIIGDGGVINTSTPSAFENLMGRANINTVDGLLQWGDHIWDGPNDTIWPTPPAFDGDLSGLIWNNPDFDPATYKQFGDRFGEETFDEDQIWFAKQVMAVRPEVKFYASLWSPPYWMKSNQNVRNDYPWNPTGQPKDEYPMLLNEYYDEFAIYLAEYAYGMMAHYGVPIYALSPTNETEIAHGYSGYVFQGDDYERFLLDYLFPVWEAYQTSFAAVYGPDGYPNPKIAAPEGTRQDRSTSPVDLGTTDRPGYGTMMSNSEIYDNTTYTNGKASIYSTHLYEYNQMNYEARIAAAQGNTDPTLEDPFYPSYLREYEDIWMAELGTPRDANGLLAARTLANLFGSDPGFTAFMWWWPTGNLGSHLSGLSAGTNALVRPSLTGQHSIIKAYYTSGQFSRFVNAGYVRVGVDRINPYKGANVTAYKNGNDFAIVVINEADAPKTLTFNLSNVGGSPTAVTPYRTSPSENIKRLAPITVVGGADFDATLAPLSVTTFVYSASNSYLPGLNQHIYADVLQAEDNDGQSGTIAPATGGLTLSSGAALEYDNFNFANGLSAHNTRILANGVSSASGGAIEVRVDVPAANTLIGVVRVPAGAAGGSYAAALDTGDRAAYGFKDFRLTFTGGDITVDNFTFDGAATPVSGQLIKTIATNPAIYWQGAGASAANSSDQTYSQTSLFVSGRNAGGGVVQTLDSWALQDGYTYKVKAQIIPTVTYATAADRPDATIKIVSYKDGVSVDEQVAAARADLWTIDWSQVDGEFIYSKPTVAYDKQQIEIVLSGTDSFYLSSVSMAPVGDTIYTVKFKNQSAESVVYAPDGAVVERPADPARGGYRFEGWLIEGTNTAFDFATPITEDIVLTASWRSTGSFGGGGGSSSSPSTTQPVTTTPAVTPGDEDGVVSGPLAPFRDAADVSDWAKAFVERLVTAQIISGRTDGSIDPRGDVTRAEFTKMAVLALNIQAGAEVKTFADVNAGDWYKEFVDKASASNVINGVSEDRFAPNDRITRQDICTILYRTLITLNVALPAADGGTFPDAGLVGDYAKDAVSMLKQLNIVSGRTDGSFDPAANATREETAKIICGVIDYVANAASAIGDAETPTADEAPATSAGAVTAPSAEGEAAATTGGAVTS
ncbi:MAG: S-layer homology domain-containing protein [Clostridiales Family XIII bacterium]|jgi:glucuronoarabinoxylan endo-1,4-beta-xylanase|nr:S-layer homology domain-containing protein [Clostridiales Family XIII bacterium]